MDDYFWIKDFKLNLPRKLRYKSIWSTQSDDTEVVIPICITVNPKLKVFVPDCVHKFQSDLCARYQHSSLFRICLINIFQFLHDKMLYK